MRERERQQEYPQELEIFEKLGSEANSLPTSHKCVSKMPWTCLKIHTEFLLEFQSNVSKVPSLFQNVLINSRGNALQRFTTLNSY